LTFSVYYFGLISPHSFLCAASIRFGSASIRALSAAKSPSRNGGAAVWRAKKRPAADPLRGDEIRALPSEGGG